MIYLQTIWSYIPQKNKELLPIRDNKWIQKFAGYTQKSVQFLYNNNEQSEEEIMKIILFTIIQ